MTHTKLATLLIPTLLSTVAFNAYSSPEVLNHYPACDYEVLNTTKASQRLKYQGSDSRQAQVDKEFQELMGRIKKEAIAANAQGIAITDKEVEPTGPDNATIRVEVEFIGACDAPADGTGEITPYNARGKRQHSFSMGSYSFDYSITLDLNQGKAQIVETDLGDNVKVGPEIGLYGLKLGASKQQMLDKFGTPTLEFALSEDAQLISYGRDHWLVIKSGKLARVTYGKSLFSRTFINYLPFDERFDDRQWQITPQLSKGAKVAAEKLDESPVTLTKQGETVHVHTDRYLANNQKNEVVKVTGFTLEDDSEPVTMSVPAALMNNKALSFLADTLNNGNVQSIALDDVPFSSFGRSQPVRRGQYHLFSATTLIETVGKNISKVHVNPGYLAAVEPDEADWQFGDFYFGQSEEDALAVAGDTAFYFDNMLEYERDNYTAKIYLEPHEDSYRVHSMEISVY
ncbi:hypothetical protein [Alteromonas halophila]|uniref:Uncharacterized protein n=1 Tax=Alteromonas halophila TaxID=516698 RepID=A0A918MX86_9ALTE|nr:hypothetical protein [Alteromonas halophila]GGW81682.1 hypothetical protein GCM10007391_13630 [Alteromonas halophila]